MQGVRDGNNWPACSQVKISYGHLEIEFGNTRTLVQTQLATGDLQNKLQNVYVNI